MYIVAQTIRKINISIATGRKSFSLVKMTMIKMKIYEKLLVNGHMKLTL
jgi:hypothetical protein